MTVILWGISFILALQGLTIAAVGADIVEAIESQTSVPQCAEDETYLVGKGNFEDGRWSEYKCLHPDNIPEKQVARIICQHPKRWYVEYTACHE